MKWPKTANGKLRKRDIREIAEREQPFFYHLDAHHVTKPNFTGLAQQGTLGDEPRPRERL